MRVLLSAIVVALAIAWCGPVSAQTSDNRALYDRVDRLERDLQSLQAQLARGGVSSLVLSSPSAPAVQAAAAPGPGGDFSERLDELTEQLRDLTGKLEEANHKATQNAAKLDRMQADTDLRFKDIQQSIQQLSPQQQTNAATPAAEPPPVAPEGSSKPGAATADGSGFAKGPQVLGTISDKDLKKSKEDSPVAEAPRPVAKPMPKDPKAAYDSAYALYQARDFDGAQDAFKAFRAKFPEHQLAASAAYWQGESAFSQKDFRQAVTTFAEAYKKYPNSTKAPDILFKMGASFGQLNMTKEACRAYRLLGEDYPDMPDRLTKAVKAEKTKLGC